MNSCPWILNNWPKSPAFSLMVSSVLVVRFAEVSNTHKFEVLKHISKNVVSIFGAKYVKSPINRNEHSCSICAPNIHLNLNRIHRQDIDCSLISHTISIHKKNLWIRNKKIVIKNAKSSSKSIIPNKNHLLTWTCLITHLFVLQQNLELHSWHLLFEMYSKSCLSLTEF